MALVFYNLQFFKSHGVTKIWTLDNASGCVRSRKREDYAQI